MTKPETLVAQIAEHEAALKAKKAQLDKARQTCKHQWVYTYIPEKEPGHWTYSAGYGRYGDYDDGRRWVADKIKPKWRRVCSCCLKEQETMRTKEETHKGDIPGTEFTGRVPVFG